MTVVGRVKWFALVKARWMHLQSMDTGTLSNNQTRELEELSLVVGIWARLLEMIWERTKQCGEN